MKNRFKHIPEAIAPLISGKNRLFFLTVFLPTVIAVFYFGLIKSDIYISESHFIVRTPQRHTPTGLEAVLQGAGFSGSTEDTYSIHDYMTSRDALGAVDEQLDLRTSFGSGAVDPFSRFNPLGLDDSFEALYRHYRKHVEVYLNASSSISVLKVRAFTSEDAYRINELLLGMGEMLINRLNERGRKDLIRYAHDEVELAAKKTRSAALELAAYRNEHGIFDPVNQSALQLQQISKLQDEFIAVKTRLAQVSTFTPRSPQIPSLKNSLATIEAEMENEMRKVAGSKPSLTSKAVEYQRLVLELGFAEKQLAAAMTSLEQARSEAQRKQLYLERIVRPNKPDVAIEPRRFRAILTTFLVGLIAWGILSILIAGIKEHHD